MLNEMLLEKIGKVVEINKLFRRERRWRQNTLLDHVSGNNKLILTIGITVELLYRLYDEI